MAVVVVVVVAAGLRKGKERDRRILQSTLQQCCAGMKASV